MCGISGIWNFSGKLYPLTIEKFSRTLKHRGPDGEGFYYDDFENVGLGHHRLAIFDLSDNGRQPMQYADGRYWIVYNGEVFNFMELRDELEKQGFRFRSQSDTEVILAAYQRWGKDCLFKFNGMWAFAIWDKADKTLFLARDRFGIKPLYYLYLPGRIFAFASETIAFLELDQYTREFDHANIVRVLDNVFSLEGYGHTIFKNIYQVLPGHFMVINREGELIQKRWWSTIKHITEAPASYKEQTEEFRKIFQDACALRMRSDVPIATALSGGIDSSAVYCMLYHIMHKGDSCQRVARDWQRAFVATFPGTAWDESAYASSVIDYTKGDAVYINPQEPNLGQSIISTTIRSDYIYLTPNVGFDIYAAMNRKNIKVSLDGHGLDEMMFGYPDLVKVAYLAEQKRFSQGRSVELGDIFVNMHTADEQDEAREFLTNSRGTIIHRMYTMFTPELIKQVYRNLKRWVRGNSAPGQNWLLQPDPKNLGLPYFAKENLFSLSALDRVLCVNFHKTRLPTILRNFDRASMASGVEVRMPYMDWRLVTYVFGLPLESKIGHGYTKRILRDAMAGIMPESIRARTVKIGLNAPMVEWFSGMLSEFIMDQINSAAFIKSNIWNGPAIRDFAAERVKNRTWKWDECIRFWPYLNAHILMHRGN